MFTRRKLFSLLGYAVLSGLFSKVVFGQSGAEKTVSVKEKSPLPPHNEALSLVWGEQQALIRQVETKYAQTRQTKQKEYVSAESRWWFDAENRDWKVARPFPPGGIDSTHWFNVSYLIDGKTVAEWFVDTEQKIVRFDGPK